jgi:hypothetical protein
MTRSHFVPSISLGLALLSTSGCALFGDPLLGSWDLVESDHYNPLTTTTTEGDLTTSVTVTSTLTFEELEDGDILGKWTETFTTTTSGPSGTETTDEGQKADATATRESKGEYELDIDGTGDWLCELSGSELDCEDDDLANVIYERHTGK